MNNEKTEWCSECDSEVTLNWDIEKDGYCCYCPYCGKRLMLCQYCDGTAGGECDWEQNGGANTLLKTKIERKTEIDNKIYDLKRVIKNCENIIKANKNEIKKLEAEKERSAFERVEKGLHFYCVEVNELGVTVELHIDNRLIFSDAMFKNNNYFLTKERAEEVADKIKFLLKLERLHDTFCPDYKPDWGNISTTKWWVAFNNDQKVYKPYWTNIIDSNITYFNSEETTEKVCEILNKEIANETL